MVFGKFQSIELSVGRSVGGLFGIVAEAIKVDVLFGQELDSVRVVLVVKKVSWSFGQALLTRHGKQTHLFDYTFVDQRLLFGGHNEVVCIVFVIDDVFEINTGFAFQVEKELLIEYEGHATALFHFGLFSRVVVDKVGRDADGETTAELFAIEAWQRVASTVSADDDVEGALGDRVVFGQDSGLPTFVHICRLIHCGLDDLLERRVEVHLNAHEQGHFEQHVLQLTNTNVIYGTGTKFAVKLLGAQTFQVNDGVRPWM